MVQARRGKVAVKQYLAKIPTQEKGVGSTHQVGDPPWPTFNIDPSWISINIVPPLVL